jgi:hypothetical protein
MIAPFVGICHVCGFDHGDASIPDELTLDNWKHMYFAQCELTDELSEKLRKKSPKELMARIKELEDMLEKANATITNMNRQYLSPPITYGVKE